MGLSLVATFETGSADNSAIKPVRTRYGGKSFYAAIIDAPLPAPPASDRPDTHCIRMVAAALQDVEAPLKHAISLYGAERIGICVGGCDNGSELSLWGHRRYVEERSFPSAYRLEMQSADYVAAYIADLYGLKGPAAAIATACSSSATALVRAAQLVRSGLCDAMVVGGIDVVSDLELLGFDAMECLAPSPCNPFSKNRAGITLGEAAVFFVLSKDRLFPEEPSVLLAGYGETADAYHITSPDPEAAGAIQAMRYALDSANLKAEQIDYVNLHGTGTERNDAMEALAVSAVCGGNVPCSATKSVTGHTLGAAGVLATAICYETLVRNAGAKNPCLPAQAWDGDYDTQLPPLRIVDRTNAASIATRVHYSMCNSFGFGGVNVSLILCKDDDDK